MTDEFDDTLTETRWRQIKRSLGRESYSGEDRRQPPMVSDGVKWLVGVAAPVVTALIVMYSTQQVLVRDMEALELTHDKEIAATKETHDKDLRALAEWNQSMSQRMRNLETR